MPRCGGGGNSNRWREREGGAPAHVRMNSYTQGVASLVVGANSFAHSSQPQPHRIAIQCENKFALAGRALSVEFTQQVVIKIMRPFHLVEAVIVGEQLGGALVFL